MIRRNGTAARLAGQSSERLVSFDAERNAAWLGLLFEAVHRIIRHS